MEMLKRILVGAIAAGIAGVAGVALGQAATTQQGTGAGTGAESADQKSKDPYIEYRQEKQDAKKKYKSGEISKGEYKKEKSQERADLQQERATTEKTPPPSGAGASSTGR